MYAWSVSTFGYFSTKYKCHRSSLLLASGCDVKGKHSSAHSNDVCAIHIKACIGLLAEKWKKTICCERFALHDFSIINIPQNEANVCVSFFLRVSYELRELFDEFSAEIPALMTFREWEYSTRSWSPSEKTKENELNAKLVTHCRSHCECDKSPTQYNFSARNEKQEKCCVCVEHLTQEIGFENLFSSLFGTTMCFTAFNDFLRHSLASCATIIIKSKVLFSI